MLTFSGFRMEGVIVRRRVLDVIVPFVLLVLCDCTDVSLTPEGYAAVTVSGSLSLTCTYSGSGSPQAAVWTLNDTAISLTVYFSPCIRVGGDPGPPYDILRYNFNCTNSSITLTINNITANDFLCWNCTFDLSVGQADHKSRTCINLATTTKSTTTTSNTTCELELGLGIGLGLGIQCVITCIVVVMMIFIYKGDTYAYQLGRLHGLGFGITFDVGWIIIVSLISTGNQCKRELGLGIGLSSGMPCVIACIIAVIFMFVEFKGIPSKFNIGKGIFEGLLIASVIGIIVYILYKNLTQEPTCTNPDQKPPNQTGQRNKIKDTGPPAVHTGTQNKVEPKTASKQINDIHQPLQHEDTGVEYTPKIRPLPQPPQNSDIKDRNQRDLFATIDDTQGLANETPQNNKLPPLKVVSEETKKKRKKKKKKGQMNDGNPEEYTVPLKSTRTLPVPEDKSDGD